MTHHIEKEWTSKAGYPCVARIADDGDEPGVLCDRVEDALEIIKEGGLNV